MSALLPTEEAEKAPPAWPYLLVSAGAALWVALSAPYNFYHNGDSLLPVLVSLMGWKPYFWGCNRIGMLVPLLAAPFRDPFVNLVVQSWLVTFSLFALMYLMARYALRGPSWPLAGSAAVLFLLLGPHTARFYSFTMQQPHYPVGLALGFGGLLLLAAGTAGVPRRGCLAAGVLLLLLGQWVNSATAVVLAPVACLYALLNGPRNEPEGWLACLWARLTRRELLVALPCLVAAFLLGDFARRFWPVESDPVNMGVARLTTWPKAWLTIAAGILPDFRVDLLGYAGLLLGAVVGVVAAYRHSGPALRAAVVLAFSGFLYSIPMAGLNWVQSSHDWRYWFPFYFLVAGALAALAVCPASEWLGDAARRRLSLGVAPALIALAALLSYGVPSPAAARASTENCLGGRHHRIAAELVESRCTHVCGDYWDVIPVTLLANMQLYDAGEARTVWPVTLTTTDIWDRWGRMPLADIRIGIPLRDGKPSDFTAHWLRSITSLRSEDLVIEEKKANSWVARPAAYAAVAPSHSAGRGVFATWHEGFYMALGSEKGPVRLCQRQGRLTLTNPSASPRTVTASMDFLPGRSGPYTIWIEEPGLCRAVPLGGKKNQTITVTLPPRTSRTYTLSTDAPRAPSCGKTWLKWHFAVENFRVVEQGT